jgi:hypothetical protein
MLLGSSSAGPQFCSYVEMLHSGGTLYDDDDENASD